MEARAAQIRREGGKGGGREAQNGDQEEKEQFDERMKVREGGTRYQRDKIKELVIEREEDRQKGKTSVRRESYSKLQKQEILHDILQIVATEASLNGGKSVQ